MLLLCSIIILNKLAYSVYDNDNNNDNDNDNDNNR